MCLFARSSKLVKALINDSVKRRKKKKSTSAPPRACATQQLQQLRAPASACLLSGQKGYSPQFPDADILHMDFRVALLTNTLDIHLFGEAELVSTRTEPLGGAE